jgi:class 3 adenylate cyclase
MPDNWKDLHHKSISKNVKRNVRGLKKEVTILFTDIVSSVKHWDTRGDVAGRLMMDRHNRLVFPIIKKYRGKIVKTIGDAVMASFKEPVNGVKAAIAIQQILNQERKKNKKFPKVSIGLHTGRAIVEKDDVFGDVVNVASRIEKRAKGDEILMSPRTARGAPKKKFAIAKKERFTPKGKNRPITVYKCNWRKSPDFTEDATWHSILVLKRIQKWEILGAAAASVGILIFLYFRYIRYFLSDSEFLAPLTLNPLHLLIGFPIIVAVGVALIALGTYYIFRMKSVPLILFKILNGGLGFCIGFFLLYVSLVLFSLNIGIGSGDVIHASRHLFVEIITSDVRVHRNPGIQSPVLRTVRKGTLLLLADTRRRGGMVWNKVLLGGRRNKYGWVARVVPPRLGVPEKRISLTYKFYFRMRDVYCLVLGGLGFIWGFFRFKIKLT